MTVKEIFDFRGMNKYIIGRFRAFYKRICAYDGESRAILLLLLLSMVNMVTSVIGVFGVGIYLLTRHGAMHTVLSDGTNKLIFVLLLLCAAVSAYNRNVFGIITCVFCFFLAVSVLYFMRKVTLQLFDDFVSVFIGYSVIANIIAVGEYFIGKQTDPEYRCASTFVNPLYYSFFITFAVLFCTYRITTPHKYRRKYIFPLLLNGVGMILSGSRMPFFGMMIGLFLILVLRRKYKFIAVFAAFVGIMFLLFMLFPDIDFFAGLRFTKIDVSYDGRKPYWEFALRGIFDKPIFGHGAMGMYNDTMKADKDFLSHFFDFRNGFDDMFMGMKRHGWKVHAHNILLESLYSLGIAGTMILAVYLLKEGLQFFRNCGYTAKNRHFALLCAVTVSIFINGLVDCEIVGVQTSVFTTLIYGVMGLYSQSSEEIEIYKLEPRR